MDNTNKIIYNTGVVYTQLIISTVISLLSVRFVLQALGEEDYGIYMVVAGVVALLDVLSSSMSNTSMRFMSHSLGKNDLETSLKTFNTTLLIHYGLAIVIAVVLEVGGWMMFEWFLNIPEDKLFAAKVVYQFMVVTALVTVVSVPFDAIINSHENLLFLSIVSICISLSTLVIALLLFVYDGDRLIFYGFLMMLMQVIARIVKQLYTRKKYPECRVSLNKYKDKVLMKSILSFTGWEFLRSFASICSTQIRGIIINMFFGVRLNAAEGIGKRVNTQLNVVSTGITRAITPQMNKSEGGGDRRRLIQLTYTGVKFTTFMYCLLAVPLMLEIQFVLDVWLKDVPNYTALFCIMIMLLLMIDKFTWQIGNAIRAVGNIKGIQILESCVALLGITIGYFALKVGAEPVAIYLVELPFCIVTICARLLLGKKIVGIKPSEFAKNSTAPVVISILGGLACALPLKFLLPEGLLRFCVVFVVFIIIDTLIFWCLGMLPSERERIQVVISKVKNKKRTWKK